MLLIVVAAFAAAQPPLVNCRDARGRISIRCLPKGTVVTGPAPATLEPAAPAGRCHNGRHKVIVCPKES